MMPDATNNRPARIVVVEDHVMVREGFVALISREPSFEVCGEADAVDEALALVASVKPDVLIVDLVLREGSGLDLIKAVVQIDPRLKVLVISMQDEEVYAERCLKAGASGYVMKHSATEDFIDAIRTVLAGEIYVSRKMNVRLLRKLATRDDTAVPGSELSGLSDRELQVYQMIGAGMNTREIAPILGISPKTVASHRENLKLKLGLKDGRALIQSAMRWQEHPGGAFPRRDAGADV